MNPKVALLREVVAKLTPMIAGKGLRVTQVGAKAFATVDPKTHKPVRINIPHIADDADDAFLMAIQGFIDHEVAHVLFTDWKAVAATQATGERMAIAARRDPKTGAHDMHSFHNIVEDPFIERLMQSKFKGSAYNLDRLHEMFLARITKPAIIASAANPTAQFGAILVPLTRAWSGQIVFKRFMDENKYWDLPLVKAFVDAMPAKVIASLPTLKTSWDGLKVAEEYYKVLRPFVPPPPPPVAPPAPPPEPDEPEEDEAAETPPEKADDPDGEGANTDKPEDEDDKGSEGDESEGPAEAETAGDDGEPETEASDGAKDEDEANEGTEDDAASDAEPETDEAAENPADDESEAPAPGAGDPDPEHDDGVDELGEADPEEDDNEEEAETGGDAGDGEPKIEAGSDPGAADEDEDTDGKDAGGAPAADDSSSGDAEDDAAAGKETTVGKESTPFSGEDVDVDGIDISSAISDMLTDMATAMTKDADYRVYTRDNDVIEPITNTSMLAPTAVADLEEKTRHMVAPMQKSIERMMASKSQTLKVPGFRSGRLHSAGLHRLATKDDRIFRRRHETTSKETAVTLLIDNSGSMSESRGFGRVSKVEVAMQAGYALSQTLERVGIKHEVIGFTTKPLSYRGELADEIRAEAARVGCGFSRSEPLYMPIYKGFDERLTPEVKKRFAMPGAGHVRLQQNVDGESVRIAATRLSMRRETRKVMIVLSDGSPAAQTDYPGEICADLHRAVKDCIKMGVDLVGLGIMDDSVRHYYPKCSVLNNLADLPGAVMGELKRILTAI